MTFSGPIGALIEFAIGGGWGLEIPKDNHSRVAVIRGTDIPRITAGDFTSVPFRYESDKKIVNRILSPGDIVLETAGGSSANGQYTGRTLIITQEILDVLGPTICASFCKKLVLKKDLVHPKYFYYYMQDLYKSGRVAAYDSQSTGISNFQYEAFINNEYLELPSMHMQTASATLLSIVQEKITENTRITKTLEDIAQTIFKSWFIDFDPVKAKMNGEKPIGMDDVTAALFPNSFEESELGLIPKGWEIKKVEEILERYSVKGLSKSTELMNLGKTLVLEQGDSVIAGFIDEEPAVIANRDSPFFVFGDHTCRMRISTIPFSIFPNTIVLNSKIRDSYWAFGATNGLQRFETYRRHWMELAQKLIFVPNQQLTSAYGGIVQPYFEMIDLLLLHNRLLTSLRDALLPRLVSGELQIPEEMLAS
jgi:type I restriction enzyme S subunit